MPYTNVHRAARISPLKVRPVADLIRGKSVGEALVLLDLSKKRAAVFLKGALLAAQNNADQAEADKRRYQAEAEQRRAMAVALEQEHQAEAQKNKALVVLAEAEVPKAMADAFRNGNLGIMDYYKMRNIVADTGMRDSIAGPGNPDTPQDS